MNNVMSVIENRLMPPMIKLANQRHLRAVRDGLIATIPLTVIGSIFLLISSMPWPQSYVSFLIENPELVSQLKIPFRMSVGLLSVYAAFSIGKRLAENYKIDGLSGGIAAFFTFLVTLNFTSFEEGSFLATKYLGGEGMFTAIITSILAVEVMRLCEKYNIGIRLPEEVPQNVSQSFSSLVPIFISVGFVWLVVHFLGFDINSVISSVVTPLLSVGSNTIWAPLVFVILTCIMWLFGMHPSVLSSIMTPIWIMNAEANMVAAQAGQLIPNIGVKPFIFTFIWIGGGGGTLALCLLMSFSKSPYLKKLGRLSFLPGFFNINEPLLFGLPIVLNPVLAVPFFVAPVITVIVTYFAFSTGLVPGMAYPLAVEWTVPSIFGSVILTTSLKAAVLVLVNFIISLGIYYPFFKSYEAKLIISEDLEQSETISYESINLESEEEYV